MRSILVRVEAFYSPAAMTLLLRGEAFYSSATKFLLVRSEAFYSSMARSLTWLRRCFLLVCGETLLLVRDEVFYLAERTFCSSPR